jgi:hypothetical protein
MLRECERQFVFVDPRDDVVIARFGTTDGDVEWSQALAEVATAAGRIRDATAFGHAPHRARR